MRRRTLTIGLFLIVIGVFMLDQGPNVLNPIAEGLGLVSQYSKQNAVLPPTLVSIPPSNYSSVSIDLRANVQLRGSMEVADGREIAFYVMNEGNFSHWRAGRPSAVILVKPTAITYNFTFSPSADGTYYFIFDNQDTSRRVVIFSLSAVNTVIVLNPLIQYAGFEALGIGIVLSLLALRGGRKRPEARPVEADGWVCKFCGAENRGVQSFCEKCARSQK